MINFFTFYFFFVCVSVSCLFFFFFKQKTAYEIYQCDWSSDVCSSDLAMGGPDLAALGGSIFIGSGYDFGPNQGLNLSSANIDPAEYTIEIDFSFRDLAGFQKILDFKDLVADAGLYTLDDALRFFGPSASSDSILTIDTLHHLVLTRDGTTDEVRASIDGTEVFRFVDTGESAVFSATDQIIRFFQDDTATSQLEAEGGFVDRIRIFNTAIVLNDQRGAAFNRAAGSAIDIGAYEAQAAPSADFDSDGDVDGSDFLAWQRGFGTTNAARTEGNSDDDGDVDASDLGAWELTFGQPEATPFVVPITSGQETVGRAVSINATLFDAAIDAVIANDAFDLFEVVLALEWLGNVSDGETPLVAEPTALDAMFSTSFQHDPDLSRPTANSFSEYEAATTINETTSDADEPWFTDELLERVFS